MDAGLKEVNEVEARPTPLSAPQKQKLEKSLADLAKCKEGLQEMMTKINNPSSTTWAEYVPSHIVSRNMAMFMKTDGQNDVINMILAANEATDLKTVFKESKDIKDELKEAQRRTKVQISEAESLAGVDM